MRVQLAEAFRTCPLAHRGLHDLAAGRPENSIESIKAAIERGFGIEIDVQLSADDKAIVFHDYDLVRLTNDTGALRQRVAADLHGISLKGSQSGIPGLRDVLELVGGQVPLLVEIKDQDGALGENVGALESAVAADLDGYTGDVALMSFNPHSVKVMSELLPNIPRGLVTDAFSSEDWPVPEERLADLREIPDYERIKASFISHDRRDLSRPRVAELKASGATILCWTVRSPEQETEARKIAENITFEGYLPDVHVA